jgi:transposase
MLDEVIITETPPLSFAYGWPGEQVRVPITGNRSKRILHGGINIKTGSVVLLITEEWNQDTHMAFLRMISSYWRGWRIVIFEDRGAPHKAEATWDLVGVLGLEIRLLPRATPKLNAMDHLWRHVKGRGLSNRPTQTIDQSANQACRYILEMSPEERLRKAGILSDDFWLAGLK